MQVWTESKNKTEVNVENNEESSELNRYIIIRLYFQSMNNFYTFSDSTSNKDNSDNAPENFDRNLNVSGYSLTGSTISSKLL